MKIIPVIEELKYKDFQADCYKKFKKGGFMTEHNKNQPAIHNLIH
jgi:hypothetical protein